MHCYYNELVDVAVNNEILYGIKNNFDEEIILNSIGIKIIELKKWFKQ